MAKLLPTIGLGLSVFAGMFFFTYLPQAAVLALFNGPLAALSAALLVLSEASTVFNVMARALLVEDSLIDTFDGVSLLRSIEFILPRLTISSRRSFQLASQLWSLVTARSSLAATQSRDWERWQQSPSPSSPPVPSSAMSCICL